MDRDAEKDLTMCEAATPGPWHANTSWFASEVTTNPEGSAYAWVCQLWYKDEEVMQNHKANAQFIAESREALPYWIKRAMAAEAEVERLREERDYLLSVQEVIDQVAENAEVYSAEYVNRLSQAAKEREKKLVEALRWYADQKNYEVKDISGRSFRLTISAIDKDYGQRASDTLKELGRA